MTGRGRGFRGGRDEFRDTRYQKPSYGRGENGPRGRGNFRGRAPRRSPMDHKNVRSSSPPRFERRMPPVDRDRMPLGRYASSPPRSPPPQQKLHSIVMPSSRYGGPPSPNGDYRRRLSSPPKYSKSYDNFDRHFPGPPRNNSRDYYIERDRMSPPPAPRSGDYDRFDRQMRDPHRDMGYSRSRQMGDSMGRSRGPRVDMSSSRGRSPYDRRETVKRHRMDMGGPLPKRFRDDPPNFRDAPPPPRRDRGPPPPPRGPRDFSSPPRGGYRDMSRGGRGQRGRGFRGPRGMKH